MMTSVKAIHTHVHCINTGAAAGLRGVGSRPGRQQARGRPAAGTAAAAAAESVRAAHKHARIVTHVKHEC